MKNVMDMARESGLLDEFDSEEMIAQFGAEVWLSPTEGMNILKRFENLIRADERKQFGEECISIVASYASHDAFSDPKAFDAIEDLELEIRAEMEKQ
jgi:hypothetical protein